LATAQAAAAQISAATACAAPYVVTVGPAEIVDDNTGARRR